MAQTIVERFHERVRNHPDAVALKAQAGESWRDITWGDYGRSVRMTGKGLLALGLANGDKMALLSGNRPEWHIADIGCLSVGAATAPIYVTNSPDQVRHVIDDSDSKVVVVENTDQLEKVLKVREQLPKLEKVVVFDGYKGDADPNLVMTWDDFLSAGDAVDDKRFDEAVKSVKPEDLATFVYTSGTTGNPKGVMLTHSNIWWTATHSEQHIPLAAGARPTDAAMDDKRCLSYLPLSHIAERMISHLLRSITARRRGSRSRSTRCCPTCRRASRLTSSAFRGCGRSSTQECRRGGPPPKDKSEAARRSWQEGDRAAGVKSRSSSRRPSRAGGKMADAKVPLGIEAAARGPRQARAAQDPRALRPRRV